MMINQFLVPGLSSQQAVNAITRALGSIPGVERITVHLAEHVIRVEHTERVDAAQLMQAIQQAGYAEVDVLI